MLKIKINVVILLYEYSANYFTVRSNPLLLVAWRSVQRVVSDQRSYSTPNEVSTWMDSMVFQSASR